MSPDHILPYEHASTEMRASSTRMSLRIPVDVAPSLPRSDDESFVSVPRMVPDSLTPSSMLETLTQQPSSPRKIPLLQWRNPPAPACALSGSCFLGRSGRQRGVSCHQHGRSLGIGYRMLYIRVVNPPMTLPAPIQGRIELFSGLTTGPINFAGA